MSDSASSMFWTPTPEEIRELTGGQAAYSPPAYTPSVSAPATSPRTAARPASPSVEVISQDPDWLRSQADALQASTPESRRIAAQFRVLEARPIRDNLPDTLMTALEANPDAFPDVLPGFEGSTGTEHLVRLNQYMESEGYGSFVDVAPEYAEVYERQYAAIQGGRPPDDNDDGNSPIVDPVGPLDPMDPFDDTDPDDPYQPDDPTKPDNGGGGGGIGIQWPDLSGVNWRTVGIGAVVVAGIYYFLRRA